MSIRVTRKTARLLRVLLGVHETRRASGIPFRMASRVMMRNAGLGPASFYPLIDRLEKAKWIEGEWEEVPDSLVRPPRRFYYLTEPGAIAARQAIQQDDARRSLWRVFTKGPKK